MNHVVHHWIGNQFDIHDSRIAVEIIIHAQINTINNLPVVKLLSKSKLSSSDSYDWLHYLGLTTAKRQITTTMTTIMMMMMMVLLAVVVAVAASKLYCKQLLRAQLVWHIRYRICCSIRLHYLLFLELF